MGEYWKQSQIKGVTTMKELKKGDFTGIYTKEDNKPLFYTGIFDRMKDADGRPCVFLATDPENKNTFYRWTQSDLLKRGYYITKNGKNTIPRDAARLHIIFTHSGALDGVRATVERDMFGEWIITTETGEKYAGIVGQLRNAAFCVILKTETAEEIETRPQDGHTAPETETAGETTTSSEKAPQEATSEAARRFTIYTDSSTAGIDSRGAYTTKAEARMRLEKELDEDETSRGGYIFDELRQKVTAIYNGFNLEKIPEPYRGTPNEYTTHKEAEAIRAALEEIKRRYEAQEAPKQPETVTDEETPTEATKARQEASQDATPATAESVPECPTTAGTITADTRTAGATKDTPQGQERATAAGRIAAQMKNANKPGHACQNGPGRTERAQAEQVHTPHAKSPPRAAQKAGQNTSRSSQDRRKVTFSAWMPKIDPIPM